MSKPRFCMERRRFGTTLYLDGAAALRSIPLAPTDGNRKVKSTSAALPEIPDKLYFRIGEVARLLDLPTYVLRFWETEFPQLKPNKGGTGQRLYRRREVDLALRIRVLLYDEGYTIPGARQMLKSELRAKEPKEQLPAPPVVEEGPAASIRLRQMRSELREIASLLSQPTAVAPRTANPAHRGLHVANPRRRPAPSVSASLFPVEE